MLTLSVPRAGRRSFLMLTLGLLLLMVPAASAARLTISLVRTTMDPTTWNLVKGSYANALESYAHIYQQYDLWGFSVSTEGDSIDFNYDLRFAEYDAFYGVWNSYIDQINAAMAPSGLKYEIHYDGSYASTMTSLAEHFANFHEVGHHWGWTPALGYVYSAYYPTLYVHENEAFQWVYAWFASGYYFYYVWGRGWVWSPDGGLENIIDLEG